MIETRSYFTKRVELADLCNELGIKRGIEVGTDMGIFAREFLERWKGNLLYCIDNYTASFNPWDTEIETSGEFAIQERLPHLMMATLNLQPYCERCRILIKKSPEDARMFKSLRDVGFIYIDAAHDYDSVLADLRAWYPILKKGGVFAGHDYNFPQVSCAVKEFAEEMNIPEMMIIQEEKRASNWYFTK